MANNFEFQTIIICLGYFQIFKVRKFVVLINRIVEYKDFNLGPQKFWKYKMRRLHLLIYQNEAKSL